jgi:hypothetical protein
VPEEATPFDSHDSLDHMKPAATEQKPVEEESKPASNHIKTQHSDQTLDIKRQTAADANF